MRILIEMNSYKTGGIDEVIKRSAMLREVFGLNFYCGSEERLGEVLTLLKNGQDPNELIIYTSSVKIDEVDKSLIPLCHYLIRGIVSSRTGDDDTNCFHDYYFKIITCLIATGADMTVKFNGLTPRDFFIKSIREHFHGLLDDQLENHVEADIAFFDCVCKEKNVQKLAFEQIRKTAIETCIALKDLDLDAWCMTEIVIAVGAPFAQQARLGQIWALVTAVKHFHDRRKK